MTERSKARRLAQRCLPRPSRRALPLVHALAVVVVGAFAATASWAGVVNATYEAPTERYGHGILGDAIEWGALRIETEDGRALRFSLPQTHVFEDVAPRLIDVDLDGDNEVVVVETFIPQGARLAIYDERGLVAATPYIGRTHRWLAPLGGADLDGDGSLELAYIDRPHLAKTLMIWRFENGTLTKVAQQDGLTNHRIGERDIAGGISTCGETPVIVMANANWTRVIGARFDGSRISTQDLGPHQNRDSFQRHLSC